MKKYRRSAITYICYVIAALLVVYFCYQCGTTVKTINDYYAQYGMTATFSEYVSYILQNGLGQLINAIVIFMAGFILDEVRKLNPAYSRSDEEIAAAKAAKAAAKAAAAAAADEDEVLEIEPEDHNGEVVFEARSDSDEALEDDSDEAAEDDAAAAETDADAVDLAAEPSDDKTEA